MSLFHYVTYKYIIIKDKRLGVAYYCLAALILFYMTVQIVINKAYLAFDLSPKGNVRLLVNTPPFKIEKGSDLSYCCKGRNKYCGDCKTLDGLSLNWPVESKAVTISTFMKERWEKQPCDNDGVSVDASQTHSPYIALTEKEFYTTYPEKALIKIEHSISSSSDRKFSASHRMMTGILLGIDGKVTKILNSNKHSSIDKIYLTDFLQAANISLDNISDALNSNGRTYRKNGIVLHVVIDYRNADALWFGVADTTYSYHVRHITFSDYRVKQEIPIVNSYGTVCQRIVNKRYATRIEFMQAGKIGHFSLANLLLQLASLMGLLTLTATTIDIIALYLVPNRDQYRQYVFDSSPDLRKQLENERKDK